MRVHRQPGAFPVNHVTNCPEVRYEKSRRAVRVFWLPLTLGLVLACAGESARKETDRSGEAPPSTVAVPGEAPRELPGEAEPSPTESRNTFTETEGRSSAEPESAHADSGVEGLVTIGPACPVAEADEPCPDAPFEARIVVREAGSQRIVATFSSGEDGSFRVNLPPGDYILDPGEPELISDPRGEPVPVRVEAHRFSHVVIRFDSGAR
jgi:hypothetical protein